MTSRSRRVAALGALGLLAGIGLRGLIADAPRGAEPSEASSSPGDETPPPVVATPADIGDLRRLQGRIMDALRVAQPAVVAVRHTRLKSAASGVIISPDGLVLSQFHVTHAVRDGSRGRSWKPGEKTVVILHDGRECAAVLLGATFEWDLSLLKIVEPGTYPFTPPSADVRPGLGGWVMKLGHPGHYRAGRPAMVRLGRVLSRTDDGFVTDCLINGGDSGGPFFDLEGRLAGIVRASTADLASITPHAEDVPNRNNRYVFSGTSDKVILAELGAMKAGEVNDVSGNHFDIPLVKAPRLPDRDWTQGPATRAAFRALAEASRPSVVDVMNGPDRVAFGTVVEQDGVSAWAVTKASELPPRPVCRLPAGEVVETEVVGLDPSFDVALLKIKAGGLRAVTWAEDSRPRAGTLVASVGGEGDPFAIGVVSIPRADGADGPTPTLHYPIRLPAARLPLLGHTDPAGGFVVDEVFDGATFAAGMRAGDVVRSVGGRPFREEGDLSACVMGRLSGDLIEVEIVRGQEHRTVRLSLAANGERPGANLRSGGFPTTFEHASPVFPHECGGPVVDLDGQALGVTIARSDLQGCKAIPGDVIKRLLLELRSGRLRGNWEPSSVGPRDGQ